MAERSITDWRAQHKSDLRCVYSMADTARCSGTELPPKPAGLELSRQLSRDWLFRVGLNTLAMYRRIYL